ERQFELGDFSSISAGVRIWCTSDDFVNDLVALVPPGIEPIKDHLLSGDVVIGDFTAIGCNSVIMPGNHIPEGTAIGALSFVPPTFAFRSWSVYAGIPIHYIRARNKDSVLEQVRKLETALSSTTVLT